MTTQDLIDFETEIAEAFNAAAIRAPVHLYSGNEAQMIDIFRDVRAEDWVLCSWRSHYQCLLKGVPKATLRADIMAGKSISLCYPEYRILSSAIVGGILPIAVGIAMGIKRRGQSSRVHCFIGEMTAEIGMASSCIKYSRNHQLPIRFIIEDNGKSVCSDTREVWGSASLSFEKETSDQVVHYQYQSKYPHAGAGVRVQF